MEDHSKRKGSDTMPEKTVTTRTHIAMYLGLNPNNEASWPVELLDRLIKLREEEGEVAFAKECRLLMGYY